MAQKFASNYVIFADFGDLHANDLRAICVQFSASIVFFIAFFRKISASFGFFYSHLRL